MEDNKISIQDNSITEVEQKGIASFKPDYAEAQKSLKRKAEIRDEMINKAITDVKVKDGPKDLNPKRTEVQKKMYLSESLFEDYDEPSDYIVTVDSDGEANLNSYSNNQDADAVLEELKQLSNDELINDKDIIGFAYLTRDEDNVVYIEEGPYYIQYEKGKIDAAINSELDRLNLDNDLDEAVNVSLDDKIDNYLKNIEMGHNWVALDKIVFDIDQGGCEANFEQVVNHAIHNDWAIKNDPEEGYILSK